jgi:hypothetical protein
LILEVEVLRIMRGIGKFQARARVGDEIAAEAELMAALRAGWFRNRMRIHPTALVDAAAQLADDVVRSGPIRRLTERDDRRRLGRRPHVVLTGIRRSAQPLLSVRIGRREIPQDRKYGASRRSWRWAT